MVDVYIVPFTTFRDFSPGHNLIGFPGLSSDFLSFFPLVETKQLSLGEQNVGRGKLPRAFFFSKSYSMLLLRKPFHCGIIMFTPKPWGR